MDILLNDGDTLSFGAYILSAMTTPGHTDGCMSYAVDNQIFTDDTLLIGSCR
ncbi:hypothetical protein [Isorropodon fossajaponicum symbiont]|uniref:hypothetical protein n=1 Tax=Isorropodon fossajaponicum symbiont TaxID=883811 RepID=UPI001CED2990|nr:hypothetical protein [Isorropodon fossajaponicum symbiont]